MHEPEHEAVSESKPGLGNYINLTMRIIVGEKNEDANVVCLLTEAADNS